MISDNILNIKAKLPSAVKLVAVSKFHPAERLMEAYRAGQRVFAESRPQELAAKVPLMPPDVEWHFIGHLQTNKLKMVLPHAALVHSIDSVRLLDAVQRWAAANGRTIDVLLEQHISADAAKQGFSEEEILTVLGQAGNYPDIRFRGLMGMASLSEDEAVIRADFARLNATFGKARAQFPSLEDFTELSIGMSDDWPLALEYGSTMVRIGTAIFGAREY